MPTSPATALPSWFQQSLLTLSLRDVLCVLGAMALLYACRRAGMWVYALTALPGTLAHELSHFLVALVLGAQPQFPSLVPQRAPAGWRLGSVAFHAGRLRSMPIAMAPLLLAPLGLWWASVLMHPAPAPLYVVHAWIVAALLTASLPSKADFDLAWPALAVLVLLTALALAGWAVLR